MTVKPLGCFLSHRHNSLLLFGSKHSEMILVFRVVLEALLLPCPSVSSVSLKNDTNTNYLLWLKSSKNQNLSPASLKNRLEENIPTWRRRRRASGGGSLWRGPLVDRDGGGASEAGRNFTRLQRSDKTPSGVTGVREGAAGKGWWCRWTVGWAVGGGWLGKFTYKMFVH